MAHVYKVRGTETKKVEGVFSKFVSVGDEIKTGQGVTRSFTPTKDNQTSCTFPIFSTLAVSPKYSDDPGCRQEGSVTVDMPDPTGGVDRQVKVTMTVCADCLACF